MHSNRLDIKIALDDSTACAPPPPCGSAPVLRRVSRLFPFIFFRPRVYFLLLLLRPSPSSSPPSFASIQLGFVMRGASGCLMALAKQTQTSTLLENTPHPSALHSGRRKANRALGSFVILATNGSNVLAEVNNVFLVIVFIV